MDVREGIASQYRAALAMLGAAVKACPDALWDDGAFGNRFWHVAYHALFYAHLYLQETEARFVPWEKSRPDANFMGPVPWPPHETLDPGPPYARGEILAYLDLCLGQVAERVPALDLDAPSGFAWISLNTFELQLYSIRHIQHHAGQLIERLRAATGRGADWVGKA